MKLSRTTRNQIRSALHEDIQSGDITSRLLISPRAQGSAVICAKEAGVFCGTQIAREVFHSLSRKIKIKFWVKDGQAFSPGKTLMEIKGPVISILEGERTALNFLGHLCGVASQTRKFTSKVKGLQVRILDTRKTTPLWRELEKYAVRCGGGVNHRMGLYDAVFVKENHRTFGDLRKLSFAERFEIEVRNVREMMEALMLSPKVILFDNFQVPALKQAVMMARRCNPKVILEASGGINLDNVVRYARTGVDQISIGALTHSVKAIDLSLIIR